MEETFDCSVSESAVKRADEILRDAAKTFRQRNALYGDNYRQFGDVMRAMFPQGVTPQSVAEWNRLGVLVQCVHKLTRYAQQWNAGGHEDSAHDLCVYAAILQELTEVKS